jgi:TonB family protein
VAADGSVNGFEIVEASGNKALDAGALDLVARIDPLPAVPTGKDHAFIIPLSYRLADSPIRKAKTEPAETAMNKWRKSVTRIVASRQAYPQALLASGVEGSLKVRLDVAADGSIVDSRVIQSSGNSALDEEALLMAADVALPTLPTGRETFTVVLPSKYEIADDKLSVARRQAPPNAARHQRIDTPLPGPARAPFFLPAPVCHPKRSVSFFPEVP